MQDLRDSEERFRTLADRLPVGVAIRKPGKIEYVNAALELIMEATSHELKTPGFAESLFIPEDLARAQDQTRRVRGGELDSASLTAEAVLRSGRRKFLEIYISRAGSGYDPYAILLFVDQSEKKRVDDELRATGDQLRDLNHHLEERVREETDRRVASESTLQTQAKLAAMGELLAAIAHQWRHPLSTLGLALQNMEKQSAYGALDHGRVRDTVENARKQIAHLSQTVDVFLDYYRPSKGRSSFDLLQVVEETVSLLSAQFEHHGIEIRLDPTVRDRFSVYGRKDELKQVLLNLFLNARDAIKAKCEDGVPGPVAGWINAHISEEVGETVIEIEDSGGGIPEEVMGRVFDPYFTTRTEPPGTGLGLYMAKKMVEAGMGGSIRAENGQFGARFRVRLPARGATSPGSDGAMEPESARHT